MKRPVQFLHRALCFVWGMWVWHLLKSNDLLGVNALRRSTPKVSASMI